MSMIVNTNIASMNAQRSLYASSKEVSTAMERLSTGLKINSAADDAAGFAIAESMTAQVRGLNMAVKNANDGLGLVKVIENASNDVTDMLQRIRELAVQASNGTNSVSDKQNLQNEARALIDEIDRVATTTQYNNENVLDGSFADKKIQVGYNDGDSINFSVRSITASELGDLNTHTKTFVTTISSWEENESGQTTLQLDGPHSFQVGDRAGINFASDFDVVGTTETSITLSYDQVDEIVQNAIDQGNEADAYNLMKISGHYNANPKLLAEIDLVNNASEALTTVSMAIDQVGAQKAELGAFQNRLEYTVSNLMNVAEFTAAARSRIQDADFAVEAARLAKSQVLQQTGTAMLAQANAAPQLALQLLR